MSIERDLYDKPFSRYEILIWVNLSHRLHVGWCQCLISSKAQTNIYMLLSVVACFCMLFLLKAWHLFYIMSQWQYQKRCLCVAYKEKSFKFSQNYPRYFCIFSSLDKWMDLECKIQPSWTHNWYIQNSFFINW